MKWFMPSDTPALTVTGSLSPWPCRVRRCRGRALPAQPLVMNPGPRLATRVDDPLAQQQLREPMPSGHQVPANVLTSPDQVAGRLRLRGRDRHLDDLAEMQQPGQVAGIAGTGLDPVPAGVLQLRRRRHQARHVLGPQEPRQPEAGRPRLIGHLQRAGQRRNHPTSPR
jgi:hypothetical protein